MIRPDKNVNNYYLSSIIWTSLKNLSGGFIQLTVDLFP
jgi:hypothetical protein